MGISINYQNENNIGVFQLIGEKGFKEAMDVWKSILQVIQNDSPYAVLIYDYSFSKLCCSDVLKIEEWLRKSNFPRDQKIAILEPNLTRKSMNKFGDDVAYNRGWYNIKVFKDESKAREWLEQQE